MQVPNPDFKFYRQLAGRWKNAEGTAEIILTETGGITVSYNGAVLSGHYGIYPVAPSYWPGMQNPDMFMMGTVGIIGQNVTFHTGEDIKLKLGDRALKKDGQALLFTDDIWHDLDDILHLALKDLFTGSITDLTLSRVVETAVPVLNEGEKLCECGQVFSSRFCPNCGRPMNP